MFFFFTSFGFFCWQKKTKTKNIFSMSVEVMAVFEHQMGKVGVLPFRWRHSCGWVDSSKEITLILIFAGANVSINWIDVLTFKPGTFAIIKKIPKDLEGYKETFCKAKFVRSQIFLKNFHSRKPDYSYLFCTVIWPKWPFWPKLWFSRLDISKTRSQIKNPRISDFHKSSK